MEPVSRSAEFRRQFLVAFWRELVIIWPILSVLVVTQFALGILVGVLEEWPVGASMYFTFVTGLTIGYGDLVPLRPITRVATVIIGFIGILLTGLIAAIGVRALQVATKNSDSLEGVMHFA